MNRRLRIGTAYLASIAAYLWYGWFFGLAILALVLGTLIPDTARAWMALFAPVSMAHPLLFFLKTRRELQGIEILVNSVRYEIWRNESIEGVALWSEVASFESGLSNGWITLRDGGRIPFYKPAEPSAAYSQARSWLANFEPLRGWMKIAARFRVGLAVVTVAGFIALVVAMSSRPEGVDSDPAQTAVYGGLALYPFMAMLMALIGFAVHKRPTKEPEPLVLDEMLLLPGRYEDAKGRVYEVGPNALIDPKGREFPAVPTKTGNHEAGLYHVYGEGKGKLTLFPEKLRKLD